MWRVFVCNERHQLTRLSLGLFPFPLSVVIALIRSWRVSIISTSMILCTETSRWVAARCRDNHTHTHTHTHTSARGHGNTQMALDCSSSLCISIFLHLGFYLLYFPPSVPLPSTVFTLYLFSDLSACLSVTRPLCVHTCTHVHVEHTEMVGQVRWRGEGSHLCQGKDEDSNSKWEHTTTHFVLLWRGSIMREAVKTWMNLKSCHDNPCDITSNHGAAGEGLL